MPLFAILAIVVLAILFFTIFPIGVKLPKPKKHYITDIIICINIIVFLAMLARGNFDNLEELLKTMFAPELDSAVSDFIDDWGLIPSRLSFVNMVTSMFVHAGVIHLFVNMFVLYIFGLHIEDKLRPLGFLLVYFLGGFFADFLFLYVTSPTLSSNIPLVGASGSVFAVLGVFLVHFPRVKVRIFYSIFFFVRGVKPVSTAAFLTLYFIIEVLLSMGHSNIAHAAHVGGFFFGLFVAFISQQFRGFGNKAP